MEQLAAAVAQFYSPNSSPSERKRLEAQLQAFIENPESLDLVLALLERGTADTLSSELAYFCFLVLDKRLALLIKNRLSTEANPDYLKIKAFVIGYVTQPQQHLQGATRIRAHKRVVLHKALLVLVKLGLLDWPESFGGYFDLVYQSIDSQPLIGLLLLQLTAEEFHSATTSSSSASMLSARKARLGTLFQAESGRILSALTSLLTSNLAYCSNPQQQRQPDTQACLEVVFHTLQSILGWASLEDAVQPELVSVIFEYIALHQSDFGTNAVSCISELLDRTFIPKNLEDLLIKVAKYTMIILNRLTSLQSGLDGVDYDYLMAFTQFVSVFLKRHLSRILNMHSASNSNGFDVSSFLTLFYKFTFAQPELEGFLHCLEVWGSFIEHVDDVETRLTSEASNGSASAAALHPSQYNEGMKQLSLELLRRILWSESRQALSTLGEQGPNSGGDSLKGDNRLLDDLDRNEYAVMMNEVRGSAEDASAIAMTSGKPETSAGDDFVLLRAKVIEVIARVAQLSVSSKVTLPPIVTSIYEGVSKNLQAFKAVLSGSGGDAKTAVLRDLSTYILLLGHIAPYFSSLELFQETFGGMSKLLLFVVEICDLVVRGNLKSYDFSLLHDSCIQTLYKFRGWFRTFNFCVLNSPPQNVENLSLAFFQGLIEKLLVQAFAVLHISGDSYQQSPICTETVMLRAVNLFYVVVCDVNPSFNVFVSNQFLQQRVLNPSFSQNVMQLPIRVQQRLFVAMVLGIVTSFQTATKHQQQPPQLTINNKTSSDLLEQLSSLMSHEINTLALCANTSINLANQQQGPALLKNQNALDLRAQRIFKVLSAVCHSLQLQNTIVKKLVYASISQSIPATLNLLSFYFVFIRQSTSSKAAGLSIDALMYVQSLFTSLKRQIGTNDLTHTLKTILDLFNSQPSIISKSGRRGIYLLCEILFLINSLIEEPTNVFDDLLADILRLLLTTIYPTITLLLKASSLTSSGSHKDASSSPMLLSHSSSSSSVSSLGLSLSAGVSSPTKMATAPSTTTSSNATNSLATSNNAVAHITDALVPFYTSIRNVLIKHFQWFTKVVVVQQQQQQALNTPSGNPLMGAVLNAANGGGGVTIRKRVICDEAKHASLTGLLSTVLDSFSSPSTSFADTSESGWRAKAQDAKISLKNNTFTTPPEVVLFNIKTLLEMNEAHKLFTFEPFAGSELYHKFVYIVMLSILKKSSVTLEEDMFVLLERLVADNMESFVGGFLEHFLASVGIGNPQERASLAQSFVHSQAKSKTLRLSLKDLLNDVRYYATAL